MIELCVMHTHTHIAVVCDASLIMMMTHVGVEGAVVVGKLLERNAEADYGYNAATNTYQDLVKAGIIDPLKVRLFSTQLRIHSVEHDNMLCCTEVCQLSRQCLADQALCILQHCRAQLRQSHHSHMQHEGVQAECMSS